jgi:hypothetical protein
MLTVPYFFTFLQKYEKKLINQILPANIQQDFDNEKKKAEFLRSMFIARVGVRLNT